MKIRTVFAQKLDKGNKNEVAMTGSTPKYHVSLLHFSVMYENGEGLEMHVQYLYD